MIYDMQRANLLKRLSAWVLDGIMLVTVITGFIAGLSYVVDVDTYSNNLDAIYVRYEETYGIDFDKTEEDFAKMSEEELAVYEKAAEELSKDEEAQKAYEAIMSMTLLIISLGVLGAFVVLEFLIPLWLKNGQTLGKRVFGIALMRQDGIKVTPFMVFARAILGKYTVETMIPIMFLVAAFFGLMGLEALILCAVCLLAQVIVLLATRNKTGIHDLMACTVAVDLSSQMIFDTVEEMEAYHDELYAEVRQEASDEE